MRTVPRGALFFNLQLHIGTVLSLSKGEALAEDELFLHHIRWFALKVVEILRESIPFRYRIDTDKLSPLVPSLLLGNDSQLIGVVERNSEKK